MQRLPQEQSQVAGYSVIELGCAVFADMGGMLILFQCFHLSPVLSKKVHHESVTLST